MGFASSLMVVFRNNRRLLKNQNNLFELEEINLSEKKGKTFNSEKFNATSIYQKEIIRKKSAEDLLKFKRKEKIKDFLSIVIAVIILYGLWNLVISIA